MKANLRRRFCLKIVVVFVITTTLGQVHILQQYAPLALPAKTRNRSGQVIVTMTTIPSRIKHIEPTLVSMFWNQTMPYDKFFLSLPLKSWRTQSPLKYDIPDFLKSYQKQGLITVLRPDFDYGPIGKMLYALQESEEDSRIVYIDDDVKYDSNLIRNLVRKSDRYPNAAVAFSDCKLRDSFRQVAHCSKADNRHPNLFFAVSGTSTFDGDVAMDIVQGFTGVLVRPNFFNATELLFLARETASNRSTVWKSDDVIISAYLEHRNIARMLVDGGTFPILNKQAATTDNLSSFMNIHMMEAVYFLKQRLGIWRNHTFLNIDALSADVMGWIKCEAAGRPPSCASNLTKIAAIEKLDAILPVGKN